ncbi:phytoene desaturase family protein [Paenibacillus arenosi]|uniref:NAD(P)/FAD-dependent oxidoreductase n=1 Tax=Paenibacillus arenosi TaxID=2774142 RepID=A0ABR9AWM3_9BACL|nr:NAD(P)/FAD-dependent oxidoreductase [Paenibacillus arenosi]MBD8498535.1 NAD(P)/FAD-dependent oxidoreductase [Paenibacillus arenosi]
MTENYDVIIIGAGLGGLTAGAMLANQGKKILLLEKHNIVGGCASTFRRKQLTFDAAVHLIGGLEDEGVIYSILKDLNVLDQLHIHHNPIIYRDQIGLETFNLPGDPDALADVLMRAFPSDEEAIYETIQEFKEIGNAVLSDTIPGKRTQGRIIALQSMSIQDYLSDRFISQKVEFLLSSLFPYIGAMPSEISAPYYMGTMMSYSGGGFYLKGSSQTLANSLKYALERDGGKVMLRRQVHSILVQDGKVEGVLDHKGNTYMAPTIISNADMTRTYLSMITSEHLPPNLDKELDSLIPSNSSVVLFMSIQNDGWEQQLAHEIFIFSDYNNDSKRNYFDPLDTRTKPWMILSCPSFADTSLAPPGFSIVSIMAPCDADYVENIRREKGKEFIQERFLEHIEASLPGLKERITFMELATPSTIERYTSNSKGAIYGWKKSMDQQKRIESLSRSLISGLHTVGHWTKYGNGVFGTMNGGRQVADVIIKQEDISKHGQLQ